MVIVASKGGCWRCYPGQLVKFWNNDLLTIVGGEKNGCPYPTCRFNCTSASFTRGSPLKLLTIETRNHPESNWECHHAACSIQDKMCQTGAKSMACPVPNAACATCAKQHCGIQVDKGIFIKQAPCGWQPLRVNWRMLFISQVLLRIFFFCPGSLLVAPGGS